MFSNGALAEGPFGCSSWGALSCTAVDVSHLDVCGKLPHLSSACLFLPDWDSRKRQSSRAEFNEISQTDVPDLFQRC